MPSDEAPMSAPRPVCPSGKHFASSREPGCGCGSTRAWTCGCGSYADTKQGRWKARKRAEKRARIEQARGARLVVLRDPDGEPVGWLLERVV